MGALPAVVLLAALSLAGCATLPNGDRWGAHVTIAPGWAQIRAAAVRAATDPWVWAPLAGAAVLQVGNFDHRLSRWGRTRDPVFGSEANATLWSDRLRSASVGVDLATVLFTPSGDIGGEWHYPSDTLAGLAIGNFCAEFFTDAFMGLGAGREHFGFSALPGGGVLTFAIALGAVN